MYGGTKNCPKGKNRICVPINRKAEVIQLLKTPSKNSPAKKTSNGMPSELGAFHEVLKQVRKEHPHMSYRDAQKLASQVYKMALNPNGNIVEDIPYVAPIIFSPPVEDSIVDIPHDAPIIFSPPEVKPQLLLLPNDSSSLDTLSVNEIALSESEAEPVTIVEQLAIKLGKLDELYKEVLDIDHFKEKAKIADAIVEDFYLVEYDEKINVQSALKELPKSDWQDLFYDFLGMIDNMDELDIGPLAIDWGSISHSEKSDEEFQRKLEEPAEYSYDDLYDDYMFESGEGAGLVKKIANRFRKNKRKKIKGGNAQDLVESTEDTLKYINSGYNGLTDIMKNVIGHVRNNMTIPEIPVYTKLYNILLELEDAQDTFEALYEQVANNGYPPNYMCAIYTAIYDIPIYISEIKNIFAMVERRYPDIMEEVHEYFRNNPSKLYEYGDLGDVRGSGFWGSTGKYAPNYYGHS